MKADLGHVSSDANLSAYLKYCLAVLCKFLDYLWACCKEIFFFLKGWVKLMRKMLSMES